MVMRFIKTRVYQMGSMLSERACFTFTTAVSLAQILENQDSHHLPFFWHHSATVVHP
jgi:hypothetical protein